MGSHLGARTSRDTWKASPAVTAALLAATLLYLTVESAFNARLVNVLGAVSIDETHASAISGLEFWGRVLSSAALGLALLSWYIAQATRHQEPQPLRLISRLLRAEKPPQRWGAGNWSFALSIVAFAMLSLFHGERFWVDSRADDVGADERWWMFYSVRLVDAGLISADQLETYVRENPEKVRPDPPAAPGTKEPAAQPVQSARLIETSQHPAFADVYLAQPARFRLDDFSSADWRVWIAIAPHAMQNLAKTQRLEESQQEPYTPRDIQRKIEEQLKEHSADLTVPLAEVAALEPVRRCLDALYDQSAFDQKEAQFDPALCVTHTALLEELQQSRPAFWASIPAHCLLKADGEPRRFVDFALIRCAYEENLTKFANAATYAGRLYLAGFAHERTAAVAAYKSQPASLPESYGNGLVARINLVLAANEDIRAAGVLSAMTLEKREALPACGSLDEQLMSQLRRARAQAFDALDDRLGAWLGALDAEYCRFIESVVPTEPGTGDTSLLQGRSAALRSAAEDGMNSAFELFEVEPRIALPVTWSAPSVADHEAWLRQQLMAPLRLAMSEIMGEQLNAPADLRVLLPDPASVTTMQAFQANPIVSQLFRKQVQNLTDSAFGCMGLEHLEGQAQVNESLDALLAHDGTKQFNQRVAGLLFDNVFKTRLTGTVDDFQLRGRCGSAGVTAYHRGFIPGFALLLSMLGLLYHCRKAVLYVLRFLPMPDLVRSGIATAAVVMLIAAPLTEQPPALRVAETDIAIQRYAKSHGPWLEASVRWLVKAQALYHPITDRVYRAVAEPMGITFTRVVEPETMDLETARIDRACGRVPQIREMPQYKVLRTVITHRDLCRSSVAMP